MSGNLFTFIGSDSPSEAPGAWQVTRMSAVIGASLDAVKSLRMVNAPVVTAADSDRWLLRGFTSNVRYAERSEITALRARQQGLGRAEATCAALIPIKKSADWWALAQDERRALFEAQSQHNAIGMEYLPAIARQLHHSRDLNEPFDFLTWFEFAPEHAAAFDALCARLRASAEWGYVEREVEIRLQRAG